MKQIYLNSGTYTYKPLKGKLDLEKYMLSVLAKDTCCTKSILADTATITTLTATTLTATTLTAANLTTSSFTTSGISSLANGTVALPSLAFTSDPDTGLYRIGANQLGISASGALVASFTTAGFQTTTLKELVTSGGIQVVGALLQDKGFVTQITSKTTSVVLMKPVGQITTVALTDAADTSFVFTLTNSTILTTSNIQLTAVNSGNGIVNLSLVSITGGSAVIRVSNTGVAAFSSAIIIHYLIS